MPVDPGVLLKGLKPGLKALDADLLARARDPGVEQGLRMAWEREKEARRTGAPFATWKRWRCAQVSIAWVLSVIFVRTLEDRGFLARRRVAGPGAADGEAQFTAIAPFLTAREYLLTVFRELAKLPGASGLFDARHNPVWALAPSAEGAARLLDFFRQPDRKGSPPPDFGGTDTRFLGDLYQNLNEDVRKRYALLQTPEFIEEFILDQTLDPAIEAFGLKELRLIDPTCGSGHFLLGAFRRLYEAWVEVAPGEDRQVLAQRALAQVHGVDVNPYAVAIARFRLTLEFLQTAGITRLDRAPRLPLNLCVADSLLHGVEKEQTQLASVVTGEERKVWEEWGHRIFALEDEEEALRILSRRYHVVVGNPPYIKEADAKKRQHYLELYDSAFAQFTLSAPFTERFFSLAVAEGFVGLINANAFTKRDFGEVLIQKVLPSLDLAQIVDTSGTYIPGHGIPTLLLFGRNRSPGANSVVAVMGKRGEAEEPEDPPRAPVWKEIVAHYNEVGFDGRHVSVEEISRAEIARHPWVLAGGGARQLKRHLEAGAGGTLSTIIDDIGFSVIIGQDPVYLRRRAAKMCSGLPRIPITVGDDIRDWALAQNLEMLRPFNWPALEVEAPIHLQQELWPWKDLLKRRIVSGSTNMTQAGKKWFDVRRLSRAKHRTPLSIVFAFVATHNHFVVNRESRVFKQSAPLMILRDDRTAEDHQVLLGYLNSSTVGFWCRLVMFQKGGDQVGDGARVSPAPWDRHLEYAGNLLRQLPVPDLDQARPRLLELVQKAEATVGEMQALAPEKALARALETGVDSAAALRDHQATTSAELDRLRGILISIQEEIDWRVYALFGLPTITAERVADVLVPVAPEHRPMEVRLARELDLDISARIWFERHRRTPPADVGGPLRELYRRRLRLIDDKKDLQLLETPETKRRWPPPDRAADFRAAYRSWLLDRLESLLAAADPPAARSASQLAAELWRDPQARAVAEVFTGEPRPDPERLVADLVRAEGVPYLAALRYGPTGLEKRAAWEETWELQRREDAGEKVEVPVPPAYATGDYRRPEYWTHRGKLDVPKERFVLYPGAEPEHDDTPVVGWAGWDPLQKATALSALYQQRRNDEGWEADRLRPLLAGLHELTPWLLQWHNDPDPAYGGQRLGNFFRDFVSAEARRLGLTVADLPAWRPETAGRGPQSRGRGRKPGLDAENLLAAVARLEGTGDVEQSRLAEELGVSSATVGKVARSCVEAGTLVQTSGRPKRFASADHPRETMQEDTEP